MIWLIVLMFILADIILNAWLIRNGYQIIHWLNGVYRAVFYGGLVLLYQMDWKHALMFLLGSFFLSWLVFNIGLNYARHRPIDYLGDGSMLDRLEKKLPWVVWLIWKTILSAGFIHGYFHTELL